jgi:hypothetical protein
LLRGVVLGFGILVLFGGTIALGAGVPAAWPALVLGGVLVIGVLAERVIYKPLAPRAPAGWQRTGERFVDDATGKVIEVFYDPKSGQRQYVQEP